MLHVQVKVAHTSVTRTSCRCAPETTAVYAGMSLIIPPNTIEFAKVFASLASLADNASVLAVLIVTFLLYFLGLIWARRQDVKDRFRVGVIMGLL